MPSACNTDCRRFFGTSAIALTATQIDLTTPANAHSDSPPKGDSPPVSPGRVAAFASLKQVDAGALSVSYADAGPTGGPAAGPNITVPTITLEGDANGAPHLKPASHAGRFSGKYTHRDIDGGIGHNLPQEAPQALARAVMDVAKF
jgi:pimeloyl-ACP methyl ester carboxylesterase